jgi:hypothetical protein
MRLRAWVVSVALIGAALPDGKAEGTPSIVHKTMAITGPTIIAVLPSEVQQQQDPGDTEAMAHVQFALEDTNKCLGAGRVRLDLVFADQVIIQDRASTQTILVRDLGQGVGAVLVEPGREAKVVSTRLDRRRSSTCFPPQHLSIGASPPAGILTAWASEAYSCLALPPRRAVHFPGIP